MTFRSIAARFAPALAAAILVGCTTSQDPTTVSDKGVLGHGTEVTQVSETIYRIAVTMKRGATSQDARDQALLKAAELALSKNYSHFEIVGGDGFRQVPRKIQAGPLPVKVALYSEPEGSIQVKLLNRAAAGPDAFDAAAVTARIAAATKPG